MTATSGAGEQGTGPSGGPSALIPGMWWRRVFRGEERQLGALRRWLESLLPDCPARDDVASVATELGSNAVRHTASGNGGWFAVDITWHEPAVRVAVTDRGSPGRPRVIDDPAGEGGRGLLVVKGLSVRTGWCGDHRSRLVWADVPWGEVGAAEAATPQDPYEAAIGDGQAGLASRFTGAPAWFGRSTLQWWALADGKLVAAPTAQELASLLGSVLNPPPPWPPAATDTAFPDARTARAAGPEQRPGALLQQPPPGPAPVPRDARDGIGPGVPRDRRTSPGRHQPGTTARPARTASGPARPAAATS
jgi:serine/threonine-protein kinase RsbW